MTRNVTAEIDLLALKNNLEVAQQAKPSQRHLAVIKANAYGHGAIEIAKSLVAEVEGFAVACLEEALSLRAHGITSPILLLEGIFQTEEYRLVIEHDLWMVIHEPWQVELLRQASQWPSAIWVKVDTGMHRLGFAPEQLDSIFQCLKASSQYHPHQTFLMTHFACADDLSNPMTQQQWDQFSHCYNEFGEGESLLRSVENSAGILGWPDIQGEWGRPGIMLYGISPFGIHDSSEGQEPEWVSSLQPVMTLKSEIIAVRELEPNDSVGYGASWKCQRPSKIGTVAIGYGDGYPRHAVAGTPVLVSGVVSPLVGRVSMDMITVDLTDNPHAQLGSEVVLWGKGLPIEQVAESAQTIAYELVCCLADRVKYIYL